MTDQFSDIRERRETLFALMDRYPPAHKSRRMALIDVEAHALDDVGTLLSAVDGMGRHIECLLLAIRHYDLADMRDKDVAEVLEKAERGVFDLP